MKFKPNLTKVKLIKRYKRFLADVECENGEIMTVHCPNTGSMKNCIVEGGDAWLSDSQNPKRKYRFSWELATTPAGAIAGINTHRANHLVVEAIEAGIIEPLSGYSQLQTEQKYGVESSRIDILLSEGDRQCFVEVKSVTLEGDENTGGGEQGWFPDAVSERGRKHLRELQAVVAAGHRAVLIFCVQHSGIQSVSPADHIDPKYGQTLRESMQAGVEVYAYGADINEVGISLVRPLPVKVKI